MFWLEQLAYDHLAPRELKDLLAALSAPDACRGGRDPRVDPRVGDVILPHLKTPHRVEEIWPKHRDGPLIVFRAGGCRRTREFSLERWRAWYEDAAVLFVARELGPGRRHELPALLIEQGFYAV